MINMPKKLGAEYYRQFLSLQGQNYYDLINDQLKRHEYSGETSGPIRDPGTACSDFFAAYKAVRDDHPDYFFLGIQSEFSSSGRTATLKYPLLYPPEKISRITHQMKRTIFHLVRGTAYLPDVEKEVLIYERIAKKLTYTNHKDARDHNIVGPVLLSNGVCEGHNALLMLCLRRIGIPCIKVYGKSGRDACHCWTVAWVEGIPVHCDVTWDRPENGIVRFNYMNLSDEQIGKDHFEFKDPHTPECKTDRFSYYRYFNRSVRTYSDLSRQLAASSRNCDPAVLLHFDYTPPKGDYIREISKALHSNNIRDEVLIYTHQATNNIAIIKR